MDVNTIRGEITKELWTEDFNKIFFKYILQSPDIEMVKRAIAVLENPSLDLCMDIYKRILKYCKCKIYYDSYYRSHMGKFKLTIVKPDDIGVWDDQYTDQLMWDIEKCPLVQSVSSIYESDFQKNKPYMVTCIRWEF